MDQAFLFNKGEDYMSYRMLGAHPTGSGGHGFSFSVWAPHAVAVKVAGDFNNWTPRPSDELAKVGSTGIWKGMVPDAREWNRYKYEITGVDGTVQLKADPYAIHSETRPATASILYVGRAFPWTDAGYLASLPVQPADRPLNIYEVHIGSWRRNPDGTVLGYREAGRRLAAYAEEMSYTHVELMPIMEHPLDQSWGYQVTGYYSVTSRYGTPDDFKAFVDHLHARGIGVLLDWVPGHFPKDAFALARFDGTPTYEYADDRIGEHREWGTLVFDFSKSEVCSFLQSNAVFWLQEFHLDGLRVDAVSSMLYRNYGRQEYVPNAFGGTENLEAVGFLQKLNTIVRQRYPYAMMVAEESTTWPLVTRPVEEGGLFFTHKWNMGWMHDTLSYFSRDFPFRKWHHDELTFSMTYAFSERFILAISHDEVVHGKHSLIDRMPGDLWRKFAGVRALFMFMAAHPGAKLHFMGNEIGQFIEWRFYEELEWFLLDYDTHRRLRAYVARLNRFYLDNRELWSNDRDWNGFRWHNCSDRDNSTYVFSRWADDGSWILAAMNLQPVPVDSYAIGVPTPGAYEIALNSDAADFGGSGYPPVPHGMERLVATESPVDGFPYAIHVNLPPAGGLFIRPQKGNPLTDPITI